MRFGSPSRRLFFRRLCTLPQKLKNVSYLHRERVLKEAQCLLTDYLHSARAIPFSHADSIVSHAPFSLSALVSKIPFPQNAAADDFKRFLRRFFSYRPVNEYEFFFESIGLSPSSSSLAASAYRSYFLSDDASLLSAVSALVGFGFPWRKLGILYSEEPRIFSADANSLVARLRALDARGFHRDLRKVFIDFDLAGLVPEDDVDVFLHTCRKIRVFYDLGATKGTMGELMGRNRKIFLELDEALIAQKLNFFINLGMEAAEAGHFILKHADLFNLDFDNPTIVMPEYLKRIGLDEDEIESLCRKYPYVMGKNKLRNLPAMMKAMNLHKQVLGKILNGNLHYLSSEFVLAASHHAALESGFLQGLERLKRTRKEQYLDSKLEFMQSIGFGENTLTVKSMSLINISGKDQLQERIDCLLQLGIEYSMLCRMVNAKPIILNQCKEMLHEKVNFLCNDLGFSLEYLDIFPAFLCFDLENRTKPRYKMLKWLKELGLLKKPFAPGTVLANSERRFMVNLYSIHPAAPKQWLECFSSRSDNYGNQRILFN
ncbi:transcription termination factor MTEF18, mitochondrial-like isoform X1 [Curcuma longa]|uniref:transcription termination factor MTEF18, mitochondrial-like isoform X1 n=1 Tax=Curcuma longa TaxID=136217 RepID=UPI003D9E9E6C